MPFVQFIPEGGDRKIQATLTAKGLLGLSADAVKAFGFEDATHVLLFFDPERRILGLRPARPEESGALKLTRRKRVTSLSIRPLLEEYRLVVPGKLIMEPEFDDKENLLIIPLLGVRMRPGRRPSAPKPKVITRALGKPAAGGRRGRPRKATAQPAEAPRRRGRPPEQAGAEKPATAKRRGRPPKAAASVEAPATAPKRRGRPPKQAASPESAGPAPRRRGRPRKTESPA